jgi:hypothetical protein
MVPALAVYDSPIFRRSIQFGSLCFTPHAPALSPAFGDLNKDVELTFGDVRIRAGRDDLLCLSDSPRPRVTEFKSPSTDPMTLSSSIDSSPSDEPISKLSSTPTSIYCVDCDAHHTACTVDSSIHDANDLPDRVNYNNSAYLARHVTQVYMADENTDVNPKNSQPNVNISLAAMAKPEAAIRGGIAMSVDSTREELMAYHHLLQNMHHHLE